MSKPFAVERLSNQSKALIETLYFDGVPVLRIHARLKQETGRGEDFLAVPLLHAALEK